MKGVMFVTASMVLLTALASPSQAQLENSILVNVAKVEINEADLVDGRLPPNQLLRVRYDYLVTVPALTICPVGAITVHFNLHDLPEWAAGSLSQFSFAFLVDQEENLLNTKTYGPFGTTASIVATSDAPSGALLTISVAAEARPSANTFGGCNLQASESVTASATVLVA